MAMALWLNWDNTYWLCRKKLSSKLTHQSEAKESEKTRKENYCEDKITRKQKIFLVAEKSEQFFLAQFVGSMIPILVPWSGCHKIPHTVLQLQSKTKVLARLVEDIFMTSLDHLLRSYFQIRLHSQVQKEKTPTWEAWFNPDQSHSFPQ